VLFVPAGRGLQVPRPVKVQPKMTRMTIAFALSLLIGIGAAVPAAADQQKPAAPPVTAPTPAPTTPATAPPSAPAKPPVPFPADAKIGVMNLQRVIFESKFGQGGQAKLKDLTDKRTAEVTALQKQIQTLQTELQTQGSVLSATVVQQKTLDVERLQRQLQFEQQQASADIQNLQDQLMAEFTDKVIPIAEEIRKERGLWIIFAVGQGSDVVALHEGLDLSLELVKRLDGTK
jgi:Skp family chaperone for outer membrane proteins